MGGTVAITGANGFLGRHLTLTAGAAGWEVLGIVRHGEGARRVRQAGGRPVVVPELTAETLAAGMQGARAVVHLAGIGAERGVATYEAVNVGGMRAVLEAARVASVPRVIFLSGLGVARYGMSRRTTNAYFLSKLTAEVELHRSGREAVVFRPSYIVGPGGELISGLLRQMGEGELQRVGDGSYRLQPIAVRDAAAAILAGIEHPSPLVADLVGPEAVTYQEFLQRVAGVARAMGRGGEHRVREVPLEEAERLAASGGYHGLLPDELDCLLCDEVSDPQPLALLLGRPLTTLDAALAEAISGEP